ncbi:hypothetical protein ABK040_012998 [Willaertia magna]
MAPKKKKNNNKHRQEEELEEDNNIISSSLSSSTINKQKFQQKEKTNNNIKLEKKKNKEEKLNNIDINNIFNNIPYFLHGSEDSKDLDKLYMFIGRNSLPSHEKCCHFCNSNNDKENDTELENKEIKEDRNLFEIENNYVIKVFKGLIDEVNNGLFTTYHLHQQVNWNVNNLQNNNDNSLQKSLQDNCPIKSKINRIIPMKAIVTIQHLFIQLRKITLFRNDIINLIKKNDFNERIIYLKNKINFTKNINEINNEINIEMLKYLIFRLGQTNYLIKGNEIFTKKELINLDFNLQNILNRFKDIKDKNILQNEKIKSLNILDNYLQEFLNLIDGVKSIKLKNNLEMLICNNLNNNLFQLQCNYIVMRQKLYSGQVLYYMFNFGDLEDNNTLQKINCNWPIDDLNILNEYKLNLLKNIENKIFVNVFLDNDNEELYIHLQPNNKFNFCEFNKIFRYLAKEFLEIENAKQLQYLNQEIAIISSKKGKELKPFKSLNFDLYYHLFVLDFEKKTFKIGALRSTVTNLLIPQHCIQEIYNENK